ncbi:hypothetical protein ACFPM3_11210 [Streptomyces coeruleoprunus]|uniref:Uncharacterized protein n=1 Tax=Streptomyces coeruleoprunus TaxID=285563 RepID=A0ABV9XEH8_9ACTN
MNLRMIGLGIVVATATLLPVIATAGPAAGPQSGPAARPGRALPAADAKAAPDVLGVPDAPDASAPSPSAEPRDTSGDPDSGGPSALPDVLAESDGARTSKCGPSLVSPDGVEAQTCVLTEGGETWGRTYYRNTKGEELRAVLTLMGPGARTVRTHCVVPADDEPRTCETPRERSRGTLRDYTAMAEVAAGVDEESPLLLRSGSNAPEALEG